MTDAIPDSRLATMPPKIARPLADLHAQGHLNDTMLSDLLDAAEIALDRSPLVAFAAAYFSMGSSGVLVRDTIRMARNLNHPLNLRWSAKRWRTEHDRLARRETLAALAHDNTRYDIQRYAALLPATFRGYLIPSRRRLAWEGLRQGHCIASYHDNLAAGRLAVAAVLLHGKRWTVLLRHHRDTAKPALAVVDIRGRKNALPDPATRQAVHLELDLPMPERAIPRQSADLSAARSPAYHRNFPNMLAVLRAYLVEEVEITFDGSGDSGCIDNIQFNPQPPITERGSDWTDFTYHANQLFITADDASREDRVCTGSLEDALDEIAMEYIQETNVDWYNGDGGYGTLTIDVVAGTIDLEIMTRIIESRCDHESSIDIDDWQSAN